MMGIESGKGAMIEHFGAPGTHTNHKVSNPRHTVFCITQATY